MIGYARFAYALILPAMRTDLHWGYTAAGWLNTANAIGYFLGAVISLATIRRHGPRALFVAGLVLATLAVVATGFTRGMWLLSLWRVLSGVGAAPVFIAGGALASGLFRSDPTRNATAIMLFFAGGGQGILLSGLILPALFDAAGPGAWPLAWHVLGVLATVSALLSLWMILRAGNALATPQAEPGTAHHPLPIAPMWREIAAYSTFAISYIVYLTFLIAWMRDQALPTSWVVGTWSALGIGSILGPLPWRRVFAGDPTGRPLALACAATSLSMLLPLLWGAAPVFVLSAFLFGLSFFAVPSAITGFIRINLDQPRWGAAMALYTTIFAIGQTLGPVGAGLLSDATGKLAYGFAAAAALLLAGGLLATGQPRLKSVPHG